MGDPTAFLRIGRAEVRRRPVDVRISDWREIYEPADDTVVAEQAGRCMDCGIPFCHQGCPLGNLIPEWNDLVWRDDWQEAIERLHATNNFPEFTGRLCPAPCESACVLAINSDPVTIKNVESRIVDRAWEEGWITPAPAPRQTGQTVAVIGSGPAGLAAAQQLVRVGHTVVVHERDDRVGGLLRYGIPEFKMEKSALDRRVGQLAAEGVRFRTGVEVGVDVTAADLRRRYDAVVIAVGATAWRELAIPGRDAPGVHQAMEYLPGANRATEGDFPVAPIDARGMHVVIIGGGDTGADCYGTATRQGAASVTQLDIHERRPTVRGATQPWPTYPDIYRVGGAHEEGGRRVHAVLTRRFVVSDDGRVRGLELVDIVEPDGRPVPVEGTDHIIPCDLALLALGFSGPEQSALLDQLQLDLSSAGVIARADDYSTGLDGVFVAGDAGRGQSLIVWAIAEGRAAAASVDRWLQGSTDLPSVLSAGARPINAGGRTRA